MALAKAEQADLEHFYRAAAYGDGLFETLRVSRGQIPLLQGHLCRLRKGMTILGLEGELQLVEQDLRRAGQTLEQGLLKLLLVRQHRQRGYAPQCRDAWFWVETHPLPAPVDSARGIQVGWAGMVLARQPRLAGIKHLNRLEQVLAAAERLKRKLDELWLCDSSGCLVEGVQGNVFLWMDGGWCTPELSHAGIAGVVRAWVLERLRAWDIPCEVRPISQTEATHCQAAFMTASGQGIMAVASVDDRPLEPHHAHIRQLQRAWNQMMRSGGVT